MKAIETVSGQALWHAHSSEEKKLIRNLDLPIAIPDLNNDDVVELLSVFEKVVFYFLSNINAIITILVPIFNIIGKNRESAS